MPTTHPRPRLISLLAAIAVHLLLSAFLWAGVGAGRIAAAPAWCLTAYIYGGLALLYALRHWRGLSDPAGSGFTFAQVLHNLGAILLAYALIAESRPQAMQYLCLLLVFGLLRLERLQSHIVVALSIVGLGGIVAYNIAHAPDRHHITEEMTNVGMSLLVMPTMLFVSGYARRLRAKLKKQKAELADTLARMEALSVRDALTGVFTRRHLQSLAEAECLLVKRTGQPLCLALLDIDHFKRVNDRFGHAVGDAVLVEFAKQIERVREQRHVLGRWGGEEFLVLMPETDEAQAMEALRKMQQAVRGFDWARHAAGLAVTFSAGVSQHAAAGRLADAIAAADEALYLAKAEGRDRVRASRPRALTA